MTDLPIGSLWRSRHNADIRIILDVLDAHAHGSSTYLIVYYDSSHECNMTTISSIGEWTYEWIVL
jgi:hypothetical protein